MMKLAFFLATLPCLALAFAPSSLSTQTATSTTNLHIFNKKQPEPAVAAAATKSGSGNSFEKIFKGGLFVEDAEEDEIMTAALQIASKIKSTRDLGWTQPPRRKGNARPRSRAWGGEGEEPVQFKANYDESKENCVEKWLTIEDLITSTRSKPGPAIDTVFVALAGGAKYAERDVCEAKIEQWTAGAARGKINEEAFKKTVKDGRFALFAGYASFLSVNSFFASCIVFPTNPAAKALESLVDSFKDSLAPLSSVPPPV